MGREIAAVSAAREEPVLTEWTEHNKNHDEAIIKRAFLPEVVMGRQVTRTRDLVNTTPSEW